MESLIFILLEFTVKHPDLGGGGGGLPYESDRDALHLALGCKKQILVSIRVFGMESHYICPFRCRLVMCVKKFTKNALTLTLRAQLNLQPHPHWSPLGFNLNFPTSIPITFI